MSPEQARGRTLDKRADIWAFGCVLYEMLAGRARLCPARRSPTRFPQSSPRSQTGARCPPISRRPVARLLHRCLAKDPRHRLHDIADARLDLDEMLWSPVSAGQLTASALDDRSLPRRSRWTDACRGFSWR